MRWHSQNLNEKFDYRRKLNPRYKQWRFHRRGWAYYSKERSLGIELCIPDFTFNLSFSVDQGEGSVTLGVCLVFFSLYFTLDYLYNTRLMNWMEKRYKYESRDISLRVFNWAVWWNLWTPTHSWSSTTPKWRNGSFCFPDFFLGQTEYDSKIIESRSLKIYVPGHSRGYPPMAYNATVKITHDTWKRPRWPFKTLIQRGVVDVPEGAPHPGKGTASYNCGESALYNLTTEAESIEDAVEKYVNQVNWYRNNYPL